jgi:glycosyltransferase involved in cell wall biosynthesis
LLILQGSNQIYMLSLLTAIPTLLYLFAIIILSRLHLISANIVLLTSQSSYLVVIFFVVMWLRPSFKSTGHWWKAIREQNKTYGMPVYRGSLANVASSYLGRLAISYWADNTAIGFYSLANSLTDPLKLIPNAVATSSFRSFANQKSVSKRVFIATLGFSILTLLAALLFFGEPLSWVYTKGFAPVGSMARALSVGAIMVGFGDFFNRFLGAHGKGNVLQNVAYIVGGVEVAGLLLFVPLWGAWGAIITSVLAGATYFLFMYGYYRKQTKVDVAEGTSTSQSETIPGSNGPGLVDYQEIPGGNETTDKELSSGGNIVILLDSFGFPNGMASTQRIRLIAKTLVQNNFQVKVLCARALEKKPFIINERAQGVYEGIPFEYTPGTTIRSDRFWVRRYFDVKGIIVVLARLIEYRFNHQADCIYYYGNILSRTLNRWIFYAVANILGIPIITDISEAPWAFIHQPDWVDRILSPLMGVDGVILISKTLKEWVAGESLRYRSPVKILDLPILVDVTEFNLAKPIIRKSNMAVLFAGSPSPENKTTIEFVFRAMEQVWQLYPECRLIITGFEPDKSQKKWLENLTDHGSVNGRVDIAGYLPRPELLHLYQSVSALLIPLFDNIHSQARFPTKIAEYLCSGTPVVTSHIGEVDRYLEDGVTAFISTPDNCQNYADKIIEAISPQNWSRVNEVGQNGRRVANTYFNIDNYHKPIATFFSMICNKTHLGR